MRTVQLIPNRVIPKDVQGTALRPFLEACGNTVGSLLQFLFRVWRHQNGVDWFDASAEGESKRRLKWTFTEVKKITRN